MFYEGIYAAIDAVLSYYKVSMVCKFCGQELKDNISFSQCVVHQQQCQTESPIQPRILHQKVEDIENDEMNSVNIQKTYPQVQRSQIDRNKLQDLIISAYGTQIKGTYLKRLERTCLAIMTNTATEKQLKDFQTIEKRLQLSRISLNSQSLLVYSTRRQLNSVFSCQNSNSQKKFKKMKIKIKQLKDI